MYEIALIIMHKSSTRCEPQRTELEEKKTPESLERNPIFDVDGHTHMFQCQFLQSCVDLDAVLLLGRYYIHAISNVFMQVDGDLAKSLFRFFRGLEGSDVPCSDDLDIIFRSLANGVPHADFLKVRSWTCRLSTSMTHFTEPNMTLSVNCVTPSRAL